MGGFSQVREKPIRHAGLFMLLGVWFITQGISNELRIRVIVQSVPRIIKSG